MVDLLQARDEIRPRMRRLFALFVLWVGLIAAGAPAFACATAAAAGNCCPVDGPFGCAQLYEQLGAEATACCVTAAAPSVMVSAEWSRELHIAQSDHGSVDPVAAVASLPSILHRRDSQLALPIPAPAHTDASLTYLHTARLRL
jgi:hypothetical protein